MDGFEVNKILGAVLGTALLIIAIGRISEAVYEIPEVKQAAFPVDLPEGAAGGGEQVAAAKTDLGTLLAAADPAKGERIARAKCTACHTLDKGQTAATGPNLYGIVGGKMGHMGDAFNYSSAMKKMMASNDTWTYENLWEFLGNPKAFMPGTAMTFVGLPKETERADVIAWLHSNADSQVPFPAPQAAAAEPAAGAPGETPSETSATVPEVAPSPPTAPGTAEPPAQPSGGSATQPTAQ